ncbi:MAG TPA: tetratricopeptide repeat protein [Thermoanaerobaculia bacterium]|nr:tetratricopeptide repeat protein [Thermoanaerobaculia bacterium]HUM30971.1 tetratricopeptide repeat protein [Thermoanaerobaculia bacterium]HXK69369.1 tetratricopeptide repeat protein [Thermoanaerobaculia bacterium]
MSGLKIGSTLSVPFLSILILLGSSFLLGATPEQAIREGNRAFSAGKLEEAMQAYTRAESLSPANPVIAFNIGDVLYAQKEYDKAMESFEKASMAKDVNIAQAAYFNMGNCSFQKEDYMKAIEHYSRALDLSPEDMDAKVNLELARKKLKEQSQMQQQEQQQQQQQQQQNGQNQDQQKQQEQGEKKENQSEEQKGASANDKKQEEPKDQQAEAQEDKEISKEEAEKILDALRRKETEEQKEQQMKRPSRVGRGGRDW